MELRQLRYAVAVARRRHFTAAAADLHVAQPALSQQIKLLERELGVALFDRSGHRVRPTAAGEAFLARAERLLAEADSARAEMAEFAGLARGRVVIGSLPSLAERQLPALLAAFHALYPGIELFLREETTTELLALVRAGEADVALLHRDGAEAPPANIVLETLFTEDLIAIVAPAHRFAARERLSLQELGEEPFIASKPGSAIRRTVLDACAAEGIAPRIAFESGGTATVRALAAAGLGVAVLPRSDALAEGPPVAVVPLDAALMRTVALAWSPVRYHSAAAAAFLAFARDALRRPPDEE